MNPWLVIGIIIAAIVAAILLFSLVFTWLILKIADHHVRKTVNAHGKKIAALLPGTDCGQCGYESCLECAKAIVCSQESPNACSQGDEALAEQIFAAVLEFQAETKRAEDPAPRRKNLFARHFPTDD